MLQGYCDGLHRDAADPEQRSRIYAHGFACGRDDRGPKSIPSEERGRRYKIAIAEVEEGIVRPVLAVVGMLKEII